MDGQFPCWYAVLHGAVGDFSVNKAAWRCMALVSLAVNILLAAACMALLGGGS